MEYLHLIADKTTRELVQRVAQNDPTLTELTKVIYADANLPLALGHALIGNSHLTDLRLKNLVLTEMAAHALAQGMAQSKIENLELFGGCKEELPSQESSSSPGSICDIFYRGIQASTTIQILRLWQCLTDDPGNAWKDALLGVTCIRMEISNGHGYVRAFSEVLSRATLLRDLSIKLVPLEARDITILAVGLSQNTSLTNLQLINVNNINHQQQGQLLFAQGLHPNSAITVLTAIQCRIDDGCVELLVDRWLPNCRMKELYLCYNKVGPTGAQCLMQALAAYPTMLKLYLYNNKNIGYEGLRLVGNELENLRHLTHLDLEQCTTWNDNLKAGSEEAEAQATACQQAGQALLDGIKHNVSITGLMLRDNHLPLNVVDEIDFYCALNKMGRYLLSAESDHGVALSVWCYIFAKCQHQANFGTSLVYFYLKELPIVVQQPRRL